MMMLTNILLTSTLQVLQCDGFVELEPPAVYSNPSLFYLSSIFPPFANQFTASLAMSDVIY